MQFVKLSETSIIDTMSETDNILVVSNGNVKQLPSTSFKLDDNQEQQISKNLVYYLSLYAGGTGSSYYVYKDKKYTNKLSSYDQLKEALQKQETNDILINDGTDRLYLMVGYYVSGGATCELYIAKRGSISEDILRVIKLSY